MAKLTKTLLVLALVIILVINFIGCDKRQEEFEANGYFEATEFNAYTRNGNTDMAKFLSEHEEPWYDKNTKSEIKIKIGDNNVKLLYKHSELIGSRVYDKYLCKENPSIQVYCYKDTDYIGKIVVEEFTKDAPLLFLPDYEKLIDAEDFTEFFKAVYDGLGYDFAAKTLSYQTQYIFTDKFGRTEKSVDEFYITAENEELKSICVYAKEKNELFGNIIDNFSVEYETYSSKRKIKKIELNFDIMPPEEVFTLTEEEAMIIVMNSLNRDDVALEYTNGEYVIRYEDGYTKTFREMKHTIFLNNVAILVRTLDSPDGISSCGMIHFIFPSDVTFP